MTIRAWTDKDNVRSFDEGWGLFNCDSGRLRIQRLDDPHAGRPEKCECDDTHEQNDTCCRPCWADGFRRVPKERFTDDAFALDFVMEEAAFKGGMHRIAILLAAGIKPPKKRRPR